MGRPRQFIEPYHVRTVTGYAALARYMARLDGNGDTALPVGEVDAKRVVRDRYAYSPVKTVFHDAARASHILLPVIPSE